MLSKINDMFRKPAAGPEFIELMDRSLVATRKRRVKVKLFADSYQDKGQVVECNDFWIKLGFVQSTRTGERELFSIKLRRYFVPKPPLTIIPTFFKARKPMMDLELGDFVDIDLAGFKAVGEVRSRNGKSMVLVFEKIEIIEMEISLQPPPDHRLLRKVVAASNMTLIDTIKKTSRVFA